MIKKAFTLIEILITIAIISLAMVGISTLTWTQVSKMREKVTKEDFSNTYNAVLLNAIWSSNVQGQGKKNELVIYDAKVATSGFDTKPTWNSAYLIYRNKLPWNATIVFDNYSLGCTINGQTGENVSFELYSDSLNFDINQKQPIGCYEIDLGTCKLLERRC